MTNIDKLLNFLDEHDALHNFFAESEEPIDRFSPRCTPQDILIKSTIWRSTIDGWGYWKNLYDKAGEL